MSGVRVVEISAELLLQLFTLGEHPGGYAVIESAIPEDAKMIGVLFNRLSQAVGLVVSSESLEAVEAGAPTPRLTPIIHKLASRRDVTVP